MLKSWEVKVRETSISTSKPTTRMMLLQAVAEEEAAEEAVVVAAVPLKVEAEGKMPSRLSRRPRKTSPPYEVTEP
jgi:hypothetical protein